MDLQSSHFVPVLKPKIDGTLPGHQGVGGAWVGRWGVGLGRRWIFFAGIWSLTSTRLWVFFVFFFGTWMSWWRHRIISLKCWRLFPAKQRVGFGSKIPGANPRMCRWLHEEPAQCTEGAGPGGRWQGTNITSTILPNITVKKHASSIFDQTISLPWGISESNLLFDQILEMSSSRCPVDVTEIHLAQVGMFALFSSVAAMLGSPGQAVS